MTSAPTALGVWQAVPRPARPIIKELVIHGPQSRTALARTLDLSTGSLTRLTKPLVASGLIVERDVVHDAVNGRPTRPLDVAADGHHFLGVKLTADHMYAVITDLRARVVASHSEPITDRTPDAVCRQARRLLTRLTTGGIAPMAAGITLGGDSHSPTHLDEEHLVDAPFLGWRQVPIVPLMTRALGIPCVVKNDVAALAHTHHWFGPARGLHDFALVTIGAGIGYALTLHDHIVQGTEADLGEFSHHILDRAGPMCPEGHRGCATSYLATASILTAAAQGLQRPVAYEDVVRLAGEGDPVCSSVVREAGHALGMLVANIATLSMVRTVIVAGEGVGLARVAWEEVDRGIRERRRHQHNSIEVSIQPDDFGEWARGGAVVAIQAFVTGNDRR